TIPSSLLEEDGVPRRDVYSRTTTVNTGILDTRLRLGNRDRVLLAIASFIIHYLGWQSARGFWGHLPDMATNRQRGFLNAAPLMMGNRRLATSTGVFT